MTKLKINRYPPIVSYVSHAYRLSIISTRDEYLPWFYSNYIQLFCGQKRLNNRQTCSLNFHFPKIWHYAVPWLHWYSLPNDLSNKLFGNDIIDFLKSCIDSKLYIRLFLDEYYLSYSEYFNKRHYEHDILIFGYDETHTLFFALGYARGEYSELHVDYECINEAYISVKSNFPEAKKMDLFRYNEAGSLEYGIPPYDFDINWVQMQVSNYLKSISPADRLRSEKNLVDYVFGMKTYTSLRDYVESLSLKEAKIDLIPFRVLWEHKKCMVKRVEYMVAQRIIRPEKSPLNAFEVLEDKANILRLMSIKYSLTQDDAMVRRMKHNILELCMLDEIAMKKLQRILANENIS